MRRFFCALAALLWAGAAQAQALQAIVADTNHAAAGYTGSGDAVSGASFYGGIFAYTAALRGSAILNVCNSTGGVDVACADVATDAITGMAPNTPVIGGHTCSTSEECTVKIVYDKTATVGDATASSISARATFKPSCWGSLPCLHFNGSQRYSTSGNFNNASFSYTVAAAITALGGGNDRIMATGTNLTILGVNGSTDFVTYAGAFATSAAQSLSTFYALIGTVISGTGAMTINVNGTQSTGTGGTTSASGLLLLGGDGTNMTGYVMEFRADPTNLSSGSITLLTNNMKSRGGY